MTKRISRKVREEAAMLCAIAASNAWVWNDEIGDYQERPPDDTDAGRLARRAGSFAFEEWADRNDWTPDTHWAEAESMLRCGWSPP